jgi:hypothetical protein
MAGMPNSLSALSPTLFIGKIWKLTVSEHQRILLNNIYGVDIDSQAMEVTKLFPNVTGELNIAFLNVYHTRN